MSTCCSAAKSVGTKKWPTSHPLDPLSPAEITTAAGLVRAAAPGEVKFNSITLREPPKAEYVRFRDEQGPRPVRKALAVVIVRATQQVAEVTVDLQAGQVAQWEDLDEVMPILTAEDLDIVETIARKDKLVQQTCAELGITDMDRVFFDGWAIGIDERWGFERRLQQALAYYRLDADDNQYAHPLDFVVIADTEREEVLAVDVRTVNGARTPVPLAPHNYLPQHIGGQYDHGALKPIAITQPEGVSFSMDGHEIAWAGGRLKMHIGFNYREGLVLSDVRVHDPYEQRERPLFARLSVAEMFVPYGSPAAPHHKKHAFDIGEYGAGYMTNSLRLGCDCKGVIHYLDAAMAAADGSPYVVEHAVCIHEEDNGLLYKHTDFRDGRVIAARDRKLIISQILTAANYDYAFYHTFTLDGTYKLEVKLTGMLNTYCLHSSETAAPYGTQVAPGIDAQNHQHIFSLRIDPEIDGPNNSVVQSDAVAAPQPTGSAANPYGNGFLARKTRFRTALEAAAVYCHETSRSWDIINPGKLHPRTGNPVAYKIVNSACPSLLAHDDSIFAQRGGFAKKALWVLPYSEDERFPAGQYVCQSTGRPTSKYNDTIVQWAARDESVDDTDIVVYVQFGLSHFPRPEDFPIMPAEPVSVMLRASHFFLQNPALWVPPSASEGPVTDGSVLAFGGGENGEAHDKKQSGDDGTKDHKPRL